MARATVRSGVRTNVRGSSSGKATSVPGASSGKATGVHAGSSNGATATPAASNTTATAAHASSNAGATDAHAGSNTGATADQDNNAPDAIVNIGAIGKKTIPPATAGGVLEKAPVRRSLFLFRFRFRDLFGVFCGQVFNIIHELLVSTVCDSGWGFLF